MDENTQILVNSINNLKDDSNLFKNYIFPVISGFFSAVLGAAVAYFSLRHQENIQIERHKLEICNKWIIDAEGLFQSLMAFKENYINEINSEPAERAIKVRRIISHQKPVQMNFSELAFITPQAGDEDHEQPKWRQISRIRGMVENYNALLRVWNDRNMLDKPLR